MELELLTETIATAIDVVLEDVRKGKYTTHYLAKESGMTARSINNIAFEGGQVKNIRLESAVGLLTFYERYYGKLPTAKEVEERDLTNVII